MGLAAVMTIIWQTIGNTQIIGYCDADWTNYPIDRGPNTGYYVFILYFGRARNKMLLSDPVQKLLINIWL